VEQICRLRDELIGGLVGAQFEAALLGRCHGGTSEVVVMVVLPNVTVRDLYGSYETGAARCENAQPRRREENRPVIQARAAR
jgi:hypothetical protein